MRWAGHMALMCEGKDVYRILVGNVGERAHWGDPVVNGRIIL